MAKIIKVYKSYSNKSIGLREIFICPWLHKGEYGVIENPTGKFLCGKRVYTGSLSSCRKYVRNRLRKG